MDSMIDYLRQEYESIFEDGFGAMTVSRGKIHKYLVMTLDYTVSGQVEITMFDYVDDILTAFDKAEPKGGGTKTSAAPDSLFKVDENCEKLKQDKAVEFHNLVAKTLYSTKRARPDTCTAIAFLTTRVRDFGRRRLHAGHMLDSLFHDGAGLQCQGQRFVPRQQEFHSFGEEW
jgi:hypothetical protein